MDATNQTNPTTPRVVVLPEQRYVGASATVHMDHFAPVADRIPEVIGAVLEQGHAPAGAPFLRYRVIDMEADLLVEAGVPVDADLALGGDLRLDVLPAGRYLTTTWTGHPDALEEVTEQLLAAARERGLALDVHPSPAGEVWGCRLEEFVTDPRTVPDQSAWVTRLSLRLAD